MLFAQIIIRLVGWIDVAVLLLVTVVCAMAFFHCLKTKSVQFQRAFKRTRTFWLLASGACFLFTALMAVPAVLTTVSGGVSGGGGLFIMLITASVCGVYLTDVKPAVDVESSGPSAW